MLVYCRKISIFLTEFSQKHSLVFFLIVHLYICFSFIHFLFFFQGIWNLQLEYCYTFFNLIKIVFLPLALISFSFYFSPYSLPPEINTVLNKELAKTIKMVFQALVDYGNFNKNPKTAASLYTATILVAGAEMHRNEVIKSYDSLVNNFQVNLAEIPKFSTVDEWNNIVYTQALSVMAQVKGESAFEMTVQDLKAFVTGDQTLRDKMKQSFIDFKKCETEALQALHAKKRAEELGMSPLARESLSENEELSTEVLVPKIPSVNETFFL